MALEEKIKFIEESKEKNYLYISPMIIKGGATLVNNYETLELYRNMDDNTSNFAKKEIVNLISKANYNNDEAKSYLDFNLIFCGDFNDLPNDINSPIDFIMNNKEKIVAVYKYVKDTEQRDFFIGFKQTETIYKYGYLYLNLAKLLEEFAKNNIKYEIDTKTDKYTPSLYRDDTSTKFVISYSLENKLDSEKGHQLKKIKKEV